MAKKVVIFHGTCATPNFNWYPWMRAQSEALGLEVYVPELPTPEGQSLENWFDALDAQVPPLDEQTICLGHSCGANFLLHVLERRSSPLLFAGFIGSVIHAIDIEEIDTLNASFISRPYYWDRIKENIGKGCLYHGNDDPYVPLSQAEEISQQTGLSLRVFQNGGHLNEKAGYVEFPELLEDIKQQVL